MPKGVIRRGAFFLFDLLFAAIYTIILYFVFTWLAGYSLVLAYCGNLALIILALMIEEYSMRVVESPAYAKMLSERPDAERLYRRFRAGIETNLSFKTILYLAYFFILVFSQIIDLDPTLADGDLSEFIHINAYSILLLIAFDRIIGQFSKERDRMKKLSARLEQSLADRQGD